MKIPALYSSLQKNAATDRIKLRSSSRRTLSASCHAAETSLFHCCCSLNYLRDHVARVSCYEVQRLLHETERGIAGANSFEIDEQQCPRSSERCFTVQRRDRDHADAAPINRWREQWRSFAGRTQQTAGSDSVYFHDLRIKLQGQQSKTQRNIGVQLNCVATFLTEFHHVVALEQAKLRHPARTQLGVERGLCSFRQRSQYGILSCRGARIDCRNCRSSAIANQRLRRRNIRW